MNLEYYGEFISDESIIRLTNGVEMKGKLAVTKGILECCEQYHKDRTNKTLLNNVKFGFIAVGIGVIAGIGIAKIKELKNDIQSEQKDKE